jgi:hypothetical protein
MSNVSKNIIQEHPHLETLAQLAPPSIQKLQKRARSKWWTLPIVMRLKYLENTKLKKYYGHAWNCCYKLYQDGQKVTSRYCNTRVCHICNRIRTAKLMNGYVGQLSNLGELEFVTLTITNPTLENLDATVDMMLKVIVRITKNLRGKKGIKVSGIRKLEITYNHIDDTYHPHFHILVDKGVGKYLIQNWLERFPLLTNIKGQHCRKADRESLNELFKYATKIIGRQKDRDTNKTNISIYLNPLNNIMECLYKRRCVQSFGIIKKVSEELDELKSEVYEDLKDTEGGIVEWVWKECDWVNGKDTLTGYIPPSDIELIFRN